jgi:hypothetical protein
MKLGGTKLMWAVVKRQQATMNDLYDEKSVANHLKGVGRVVRVEVTIKEVPNGRK